MLSPLQLSFHTVGPISTLPVAQFWSPPLPKEISGSLTAKCSTGSSLTLSDDESSESEPNHRAGKCYNALQKGECAELLAYGAHDCDKTCQNLAHRHFLVQPGLAGEKSVHIHWVLQVKHCPEVEHSDVYGYLLTGFLTWSIIIVVSFIWYQSITIRHTNLK